MLKQIQLTSLIRSCSNPVLPLLCLYLISGPAIAADTSEDLFDLEQLRVKISPDLGHLKVDHNGREVIILRHQDPEHRIEPPFDQTARSCPPFCALPMTLAAGVETIGELEMLDYLRRVSEGDASLLVIDSRTRDYVRQGTIPGSINIPYTQLDPAHTPEARIAETLQLEFQAEKGEQLWNFQNAKSLVLFCNGPWCGQSPSNIRMLLRLGYPAAKLKWYRGGMQAWEQFGLTTVKD
ncbi:MAG: rhodanese-like domain-containing protein [Candidatus Thiodiazotropha sp.]